MTDFDRRNGLLPKFDSSGVNQKIRTVADLTAAYETLADGEIAIFQIGEDVYQVGKSTSGNGFNSQLYAD